MMRCASPTAQRPRVRLRRHRRARPLPPRQRGRVPRAVPAPRAETTSPEPPVRGRLVVRTRPAGARVEVERAEQGRVAGHGHGSGLWTAHGPGEPRRLRDRAASRRRSRHVTPAQTVDVTLKRNAAPTPPPRRAQCRASSPRRSWARSSSIRARRARRCSSTARESAITPVTIPDVRVGLARRAPRVTGYRRWSSSIRVVAGERERVAASLEEEAAAMNAVLALEDGTWFRGTAAGAAGRGPRRGRVQHEHDRLPGSADRSLLRRADRHDDRRRRSATTACRDDDVESRAPQVAGFIMREASPVASNWRAEATLRDYLVRHGIVAIADIDTRALTRKLRSAGVMRGVIATGDRSIRRSSSSARATSRRWKARTSCEAVTCEAPYDWRATTLEEAGEFGVPPERRASRRLRIAAYDFGMKWNILRRLARTAATCACFPASTPAAELLAIEPDGVFLSNGPGDPAAAAVRDRQRRRRCVDADVPMFGICLGHQILGLALGGKTFKLKFGHRGANHPVKKLDTGQGRDHVAEPRLRRRSRLAAGRRRGHAPEPVRRHGRRPAAHRQAGLLGAVSSRSVARPARRGLPVPAVSRRDRTTMTGTGAGEVRVDGVRGLRSLEPGACSPQPESCPDALTSSASSSSAPARSSSARRASSTTPARRRARRCGRRARGRPRQQQPGDDHDRPGARRSHLRRAADAGDRSRRSSSASGPTRCCRPSAARPRSTSRSTCTSAGMLDEVQRRADRRVRSTRSRSAEDRLLFKDAMQEIGLDVPQSGLARSLDEALDDRRDARLPGDHPPVVHAGRRRRRHRLQHRGVPRPRRARPRAEPGARDPRSRNRSSAGRNSSSR